MILAALLSLPPAGASFAADKPSKGPAYDAGRFTIIPPKGWRVHQNERNRHETLIVWTPAGENGTRVSFTASFRVLSPAEVERGLSDDLEQLASRYFGPGGEVRTTASPITVGDKDRGYVRGYQGLFPFKEGRSPQGALLTKLGAPGGTVHLDCRAADLRTHKAMIPACRAFVTSFRLPLSR